MKKMLFLMFILILCSCLNTDNSKTVSNAINSSYIMIDEKTNEIIEGSNIHGTRSIASISKIMTAICVIENTNLYSETIVPKEIEKVDGSSLYLQVNQKVLVIDLLYGLMLRSGNDAAVTLAMTTCNTIEEFVNLMNYKAKQLGLVNSKFNNPHGLDVDDDGNISSAYDMAILYSYCLKNPLFAQIVSTKKYKNYENKNKLLKNYEYCTGGKTGFTKKARRTLVTSAKKENKSYIIVTLNYANDFEFHKNLYEKYFLK